MRPVFIAEFPTEFSAPGPREPSSSADYNRKVVYADENEGSFAGSNEEEEREKKEGTNLLPLICAKNLSNSIVSFLLRDSCSIFNTFLH